MSASSLRRFAPLLLTFIVAACAVGTDEGPLEDAGVVVGTDSGGPSDAGTDAGRDAGRDSGTDAGPPAIRADLFADPDYAGASAWAGVGDTNDLGAFSGTASSVKIPSGYVLYGFSDTRLGGTISAVITADTAALGVGDDDTWSSIAIRDASAPFITVDTIVGGGARRYPFGRFRSLGANNDTVDGFSIPDGVTVIAYRDVEFQSPIGTFVGPVTTAALPERDVWSSFVVRATLPEDDSVRASILYVNTGYSGATLVLTPGAYGDLDGFSGAQAFRNVVSSVKTSSSFQVWGFSYPNFGGDAFGPLQGDSLTITGDNDWDSVFIAPASDPTVTFYLDSGFANPRVRPLVDVPNVQTFNDNIDGVLVPAGYVVYGFTDSWYGGTPRRHSAGQSVTSHDDWTSYRVVPDTTPSITIYLDPGESNGRIYPTGWFPDFNSLRNTIDGIDIPAGLRVCAWQNPNYGGTKWELVGPLTSSNIGAANGVNDWDSMLVTDATTCP